VQHLSELTVDYYDAIDKALASPPKQPGSAGVTPPASPPKQTTPAKPPGK